MSAKKTASSQPMRKTIESIGCKMRYLGSLRRQKLKLEEDDIFESIEQELPLVQQYLGISDEELIIFIAIYMSQFIPAEEELEEEEKGSFQSICTELGQSEMELLDQITHFDTLLEKKMIKCTNSGSVYQNDPRKNVYDIMPEIIYAIFRNKPLNRDLRPITETSMDCYTFTSKINEIFENNEYYSPNRREMITRMLLLEEKYPELPFVTTVRKEVINDYSRFLFYLLCHRKVSRPYQQDISLSNYFSAVYEFHIDRMNHWQAFYTETDKLCKLEWIRVEDVCQVFLSEKGLEVFMGDIQSKIQKSIPAAFEFSKKEEGEHQLMQPDTIIKKDLFFNKTDRTQIEELYLALAPQKFNCLQQELTLHKLHNGITVIMHGLPGTGKTETALQIAKQCGRAVMHVDIAGAHTKWYGESEKLIKGIFDEYNAFCKKLPHKPILLFNEADALLCKRMDGNNIKSDETDHRIQNILLEEIEKMDGILIATTNMIDTLDKAFERRFLFKVKCNLPDKDTRLKIWESRLPGFSKTQYEQLASDFQFAGGEIENVIRKWIIRKALHTSDPTFCDLLEICEMEKGFSTRTTVGFNRAS